MPPVNAHKTFWSILVIGLLLQPNFSAAQAAYTFPYKTDRIPYRYLFSVCFENKVTCVLDLTSKTGCADITPSTGTISQQFGAVVEHCPQYKWQKTGRIYLFEPASDSDSALSIRVGPIRKKDFVSDIMGELIDQAHFQIETPGSNGRSTSDDSSGITGFYDDGSKTFFSIPAESFKQALVDAAKQRGLSTWLVVRLHDDVFYLKASNAPHKSMHAKTP